MASLGGVMNRQKYSDLFFDRLAFIDEILKGQFDAPSLTYPLVFTVRDSRRAFEEITSLTGFGLFSEKGEGEKADYDQLMQAYNKRFVHKTYAKAHQITREGMDDDIDGAITDTAPSMGQSARVSIETLLWSLFNNSFGTEETPDGVSLFNASHPLIGGGTFSNLIAGDFNQPNLESAINIFGSTVNQRNLPIEVEPELLVIPFGMQWLAAEVMDSSQRSDSANNAINSISTSRTGIQTVVTRYLTGSTDWFLGTRPGNHRLLVYWRSQPTVDHTLDFETGNMKTKMDYRLSFGAADWTGWVGGQGS